jgi:RNA polymerase sporulation-specific sigma factor
VQGLSYRNTAEKLGMTEKAVDNAMQRARKKIRAIMHDAN